ncbi:SAM-dependent methyltransferase [Salinicola halimionae]|uniref:SAM-dependent methyltransferase n=1 Tax=Salinicola halimionae TaxID=1949081 RepID=UPI001CB75512|nr:SAM-dependent methyltransferase [Salinicola halimionae]
MSDRGMKDSGTSADFLTSVAEDRTGDAAEAETRLELHAHFERLHAHSSDPWHYDASWYEQRKRALTLAMLTRARYRRALEPGCSVGALSAELAPRCDELLCWDVSASAVAHARRRLTPWPHVRIEQHELSNTPSEALPTETFDLIVFSELGYYLEPAALQATIRGLKQALHESGELVACHWRHPLADGRMSGDAVHERLHDILELPRVSTLIERDFRLDLWSAEATA